MAEYKNVFSGLDISRRIFDLMEEVDPVKYDGANRVSTIRRFNDILQGRSNTGVVELLSDIPNQLGQQFPNEAAILSKQIMDFVSQKALMTVPYSKSSTKDFKYKYFDPDAEMPLKIITQGMYDRAVKDGFPIDFFTQSYFEDVHFYCLPDRVNFNLSSLRNCHFTACRIQSAYFDRASIYDTEFHTVNMIGTTFFVSSIANTHFHDSTFSTVDFSLARLKSCNTIDCEMYHINYTNSTLDGCSFGRVTASDVKSLNTATITMGGATAEECKRNRDAIYKALRVIPRSPPKKRRSDNIVK